MTGDPVLRGMLSVHVKASSLLMLLIVVHIAGALWHWLVRKDGVWQSMVARQWRWTWRNALGQAGGKALQ